VTNIPLTCPKKRSGLFLAFIQPNCSDCQNIIKWSSTFSSLERKVRVQILGSPTKRSVAIGLPPLQLSCKRSFIKWHRDGGPNSQFIAHWLRHNNYGKHRQFWLFLLLNQPVFTILSQIWSRYTALERECRN